MLPRISNQPERNKGSLHIDAKCITRFRALTEWLSSTGMSERADSLLRLSTRTPTAAAHRPANSSTPVHSSGYHKEEEDDATRNRTSALSPARTFAEEALDSYDARFSSDGLGAKHRTSVGRYGETAGVRGVLGTSSDILNIRLMSKDTIARARGLGSEDLLGGMSPTFSSSGMQAYSTSRTSAVSPLRSRLSSSLFTPKTPG